MIDRAKLVSRLKSETWDILVIGGGITGAGIALDAATRGLKTALIEKNDFASGTSSRSTKLVHGGLRYLKQLEFALVSEVGRERAIVHANAAHLVIPEKMLMPLIKGGTYGRLASSVGLEVYDILANVKKEDRRHMLSKEETLKVEPLLNEEVLLGSGYYSEYRTDDARLTLELIKGAVRKGAVCVNYCELKELTFNKKMISGCHVLEHLEGELFDIKAKFTVNACGPWVDHIRYLNGSIGKKRLHLTKGVHIVVPHDRLPVKQSIYFDVPDGRMIFTIPRGRTTYIGTTDTDFSGDLDNITATREDAEYLVNAVNSTFPSIQLSLGDIESSWAGVRPLIHQEGKSASEISRRDEIFIAPDGLISIAGGKLTGYRKMAQKTVDEVVKRYKETYGYEFGPCITRHIPLTEDPLWNVEEVEYYKGLVAQKITALKLDPGTASYLVSNYGKQADQVIDLMRQFRSADPQESLVRAELMFGMVNEMVCSSVDFFDRRTGRLYFDITTVLKYRDRIREDLTVFRGWNEYQINRDKEQLDNRISGALAFKS
jgi:glycerol-3-phosphate dehydrogenase